MDGYLWSLIIGIILFIAGMIAYEANRRKLVPTWAMALMIIGTVLILSSVVWYMHKSRVLGITGVQQAASS